MKSLLAMLLVGVCCGAGTASAVINEEAIQTSSRSGGSLTELTFQSGRTGYFSMTGVSSDYAIIVANGRVQAACTLAEMARAGGSGIIELDREPVRLPDGRLRLFFRIPNVPRSWNLGLAALYNRDFNLVDEDWISVR